MAQHDMNIANQGFPAFRADLNSALTAIANNSSGATAPSTTFAYQWWYDTSTNVLKMRNADNDAWITIGTFNQTTDSFTPSGVTSDKIEEGNSSVEVVDSGTGYVTVVVDGSQAIRIDSSGNLLVGKTSPNSTVVGAEVSPNGYGIFTSSNNHGLLLNRTSSDGALATFRKDNTTVGSIGTSGGRPSFTNPTYGGLKIGTGYSVDPATTSGAGWDNAINLGAGGTRWKDLYLSGGVYLGGTGSANHLDDYEQGTWTGELKGSTGNPSTPQTATGYYTKIGDLVYITIQFDGKDITGASGNVQVTGIPFTSKNDSRSLGSIYNSRGSSNARSCNLDKNDVGILTYDYAGSVITWSSAGSGTYVGVSLTYRTAS